MMPRFTVCLLPLALFLALAPSCRYESRRWCAPSGGEAPAPGLRNEVQRNRDGTAGEDSAQEPASDEQTRIKSAVDRLTRALTKLSKQLQLDAVERAELSRRDGEFARRLAELEHLFARLDEKQQELVRAPPGRVEELQQDLAAHGKRLQERLARELASLGRDQDARRRSALDDVRLELAKVEARIDKLAAGIALEEKGRAALASDLKQEVDARVKGVAAALQRMEARDADRRAERAGARQQLDSVAGKVASLSERVAAATTEDAKERAALARRIDKQDGRLDKIYTLLAKLREANTGSAIRALESRVGELARKIEALAGQGAKLDGQGKAATRDWRTQLDEALDTQQALARRLARLETSQKELRAELEAARGGAADAKAGLEAKLDTVRRDLLQNVESRLAPVTNALAERAAGAEAREEAVAELAKELGGLRERFGEDQRQRTQAERAIQGRLEQLGASVTASNAKLEQLLAGRAGAVPGAADGAGLWRSPFFWIPTGLALVLLLWLLFRREPASAPVGARQDRGGGIVRAETGSEPAPLPPEPRPRTAPSGGGRTVEGEVRALPVVPAPGGGSRNPRPGNGSPGEPAPRVQSLRIPSERTVPGGDVAVRGLLECDRRVLVEPAPRIEVRPDGSLSVRFYVRGQVDAREADELTEACRALASREPRS